MLTLEVGGSSGRYGMLHSGSEFVLCLEGVVEYEVEDIRYQLNPGDSLIFAARLNHRWRNVGTQPAKLVIVLSGFAQGERPSEFHVSSGLSNEPKPEEQLEKEN